MKISTNILEEIKNKRDKNFLVFIDPFDLYNKANLSEGALELFTKLYVKYMSTVEDLNELKNLI